MVGKKDNDDNENVRGWRRDKMKNSSGEKKVKNISIK